MNRLTPKLEDPDIYAEAVRVWREFQNRTDSDAVRIKRDRASRGLTHYLFDEFIEKPSKTWRKRSA